MSFVSKRAHLTWELCLQPKFSSYYNFVHFFPRIKKIVYIWWLKSSVQFFRMIAAFSRSQSPHFPLFSTVTVFHMQHKYTHVWNRCTQTHTQTDKLKYRCAKWRCADCPLRLLHYPFVFTFNFLLSFSVFLQRSLCASARTSSVRCVCVYFLSSLACLLSSLHPTLISLPSSRTWWPPT